MSYPVAPVRRVSVAMTMKSRPDTAARRPPFITYGLNSEAATLQIPNQKNSRSGEADANLGVTFINLIVHAVVPPFTRSNIHLRPWCGGNSRVVSICRMRQLSDNVEKCRWVKYRYDAALGVGAMDVGGANCQRNASESCVVDNQ
jgi:hypothetical protein